MSLRCQSPHTDGRARQRQVRLGSLALLAVLAAGPAQAAVIIVSSNNNNGAGTLRQAITNANGSAGADVICFNIGAGLNIISPNSALPAISEAVTIDGPNTLGSAGCVPQTIELNGSSAGGAAIGLDVAAGSGGTKIIGLIIDQFGNYGIRLTSSGNFVQGNYIGVDPTGTLTGRGNISGIYITGSNNQIDGTTAAGRNVISGNTNDGIQIDGSSGASGNVVKGNYIGVNAAGNAALKNGGQGVIVYLGATNNTIGGNTPVWPGAGNLISGNGNIGIAINNPGTTGNVVRGNRIGTDATGTGAIGNVNRGISLDQSAANNRIGGPALGDGNTIANNGSNGVWMGGNATVGNSILGNNIFASGPVASPTPGIDLNGNGVDINDTGDLDPVPNEGSNRTQNHPVLTAAMTNGAGSATFAGSLNSKVGTYRVEFFANAAADATGYGEGQRYLGSTNVTTNGSGNATIGVTLAPIGGLAAGEFVSSTATVCTDGVPCTTFGDTSEFGGCVIATASLVVTTSVDTVDGTTTSVSNLIANPGADGRISLREAIEAANATAGADTIRFGIPLTDAGHVYYQDNGIGGSFAAPTATTLADQSTPSSPTIPAASYDADYPAGLARSWYRIRPTSALPTIASALVIDATTQPLSLAGAPVIELDGSLAGAGVDGLTFTTGPSTVRGLVVDGFQNDGLNLRGPGGFTVTGNYIGTDVSGTKGAGNGSSGVFLTNLSGAASQIGGNSVATRNVISGNGASASPIKNGIYVYNYFPPVNSAQVRIQGNYIGTNVTGTVGLGVQADGVVLEYTGGHLIGGSGAGEGNLISGHAGPGIDMNGNMDTGAGGSAPTDNNVIEGNWIGTNAAHTGAIPNAGPAIQMYGTSGPSPSASGNTIRNNVLAASTTVDAHGIALWGNADNNLITGNFIGTDSGGTIDLGNAGSGVHIEVIGAQIPTGNTVQNNVIRFNNVDGVRVLGTGAVATLSQNRIWTNDLLGIDLAGDGPTLNDVGDVDTGPNGLLNFPSMTPAVESPPGTLTVTYGLDMPAGFYRIEFFKNPSGADPTRYGEGQVYNSSVVVNHTGGKKAYTYVFPGNAGDVISATTTVCLDGTAACTTPGSTSEFSLAWAAVTTAVKLMSFTATARDRAVDLQWQTGSELDNLGFHLYRSLSASGPWTRLTSTLIPGLGSSPIGKAYSFRDAGLNNGTRYHYRLDDVDTASRVTSHGPISAMPTADAATDGDASEKKRRAAASCPDWVVTAYGSIAGASASASLTCTRHGDPEAVALSVVARDSRQATLELKTGGFYAVHEASGKVRVFVPGFDFPRDPQAPALPYRRALVDAVVGRRAQLAGVRALEQVVFPGIVPTALGKLEMQVSWDGTVRAGRRAAPESSPQHVSTELARLLPSVFQGETKSAVVALTPLRYDSRRQQIVLSKRLLVRLLFTGRETAESGRGSNGRRDKPQAPVTGERLARLYTTVRGLHAVSFDQLFSARSRGFATSQLRLERQGQAQGFHIEPAGDLFGPGSVLYFHADTAAFSTDYSSEVAWELLRAPGGIAMPVVPAAPAGDAVTVASTGQAAFETDRFYQPGLLDAPDPWLWEAVASGATRAKSFSLTGVELDSAQIAELEVFLQGASESGNAVDHHVSVSVNGTLAGEAQFAGKKPYRVSLSVPVALLREGANQLSLTNVADTNVSSLVFLDRFTVSYPQTASLGSGVFEGTWPQSGTATVSATAAVLLDVTASPAPGTSPSPPAISSGALWLTGYQATGGALRFRAEAGHRYLAVSPEALLAPRVAAAATSSLRASTNRADYLLIAPRAFLAAAEPLLQRRQDQGLATRAVAFEEITDEFGHGQPSAEAIQGFLAFAFQSWARPSPRYVLLLGDSSYDPRNFMGTSLPSPLPALWTKTSYLWTASDPRLAAVNGEDDLPDLAIGRLPATTVEQAQALVEKLLAWEDSGQGLAGQAALVADNPDIAGDFEADARDIAQSYLVGRSRVLLLSELGAQTRPAVLDALNSGLSYLSYVGHGGAAVWASENVWNSWDAASLQAQSQQPFLVTMNCLNGYFVAPSYDSLAESLLKAEGRGAIAAFSPSGLSLDGPAHLFHRALMAELTGGRQERLGDAVLAAQKAYAQTGVMPELLSVYHLLGDPGMKIR